MKRSLKIPLLAMIILAIALPAGFAIAQVVESGDESDRPPITHVDPDPSTDPVELYQALKEAEASGDPKAIEQAADALRDNWLSSLGPEEKAGVAAAAPETDVPPGTFAYLSPAINEGQVDQCRKLLDSGRPDDLCELIVLHGEGKVRAGAYTKAEVDAALAADSR